MKNPTSLHECGYFLQNFDTHTHTQVATDRTGTDNLFALETSNDSHPLTRPSGDDLLRARETQKIDVHGPVLASRVGRKGAVATVNVTLNCLDKSFGGVR